MAGKTTSKFKGLKKKTGKPAGISGKVIGLLDIYTLITQNKFPSVDSLVKHCEASNRTIYRYLLDRIDRLQETDHYFVKDTGFDLRENLSRSWGIIFNEDTVDITVRFSKDAALYIDRQKKWHPTETRKKLPDGSVELSFTVTRVSEIKGWI